MARKTTSKKHSSIPPKTAAATVAPTPTAVAVEADKPATVTTAAPAKAAVATAAVTTPASQAQTAPVAAWQKLLKELESESASTRAAAIVGIGRSANKEGVKPLIAALRDVDADVAREAATSLGLLGQKSAVDSLIDVLHNNEGYFHSVVRSAASFSLAQLGDVRAVDALLNAVHDPIDQASAEAVRALGTLGDARAVVPLVQVVRNDNGYFLPTVRRAAVLSLAQLGGQEAVTALRAVASDSYEDTVVRETAGKVIHQAHATTAK